jgi:hypothetical protein
MLAGWLYVEVRTQGKFLRVLVGLAVFAIVFVSGYQIGGFGQFAKYRLYPPALVKISELLRDDRTSVVQSAIAEVFPAGRNLYDVNSVELMRALESGSGPNEAPSR